MSTDSYSSDNLSILTSTDSTISNLPGAGSTLDSWLSAGGKIVDDLISDVAQRSGHGPNVLVVRMMCDVDVDWSACRCCEAKSNRNSKRLHNLSKVVFADIFHHLLIFDCHRCREAHVFALLASQNFTVGCSRLVLLSQSSNQSLRMLSISYLTLLSYYHAEIRSLIIRVGIESALRDSMHYLHSLSRGHVDALVVSLRSAAACFVEDGSIPEMLAALDAASCGATVKLGMRMLDALQDEDTQVLAAFRILLDRELWYYCVAEWKLRSHDLDISSRSSAELVPDTLGRMVLETFFSRLRSSKSTMPWNRVVDTGMVDSLSLLTPDSQLWTCRHCNARSPANISHHGLRLRVVDVTSYLLAHGCADIRRQYADALLSSDAFSSGCDRLRLFLRHSDTTARLHALFYLTLLSFFHPQLERAILDSRTEAMMADITEEVGLVASHGRPRSIDPETATDGPIGWCLVALSAIRLENSRVSLYRGLASLRTKRTPDVLASEAFRMQCQQMSVVEPVAPTRDVTTLDNKLFTVFVSSILDLSSVPLSPHTHRMLQQAARWSGWSPYFDFLKLITGEAAKQRALCSRCNRMPLHSSLLDTSDWDHLPSFADLFGRLPLSCERCRLGLAQNLASDKEFQDACANLSSPLSKQCMFARLCGLSCITALVYTDVAFRAVFRDPVLLCRLRELHERISSAESSYYKDILLPPLRRTLDCLTDERVLSILSETSGSSASADGISAETSLLRHLKDPDTLLLAAFRMHFYRHPSRDIRSPSAAAAAAPAPEKTGSSSSFQTLEVFLQKNRMDPLASTVIWSFMDLHYGYHAEWNRPWL